MNILRGLANVIAARRRAAVGRTSGNRFVVGRFAVATAAVTVFHANRGVLAAIAHSIAALVESAVLRAIGGVLRGSTDAVAALVLETICRAIRRRFL